MVLGIGSFIAPKISEAACRNFVSGEVTPGQSQADCPIGSVYVADDSWAAGNNALARTADALNPLSWPAKALGSVAIFVILPLVGWITDLSGSILNFVVQETIVEMRQNITGVSINTAWGAIRDIANMGFIFILLYAAIKTILGIGGNNQTLIRNIVIVAVLINFSLFFTRLVIDAANVLALFFYDAISQGASGSGAVGISQSLMDPLKIQSIMQISQGGATFTDWQMVIVGVMGSVFALIAAFIFFAISIMFVIRFVALVFVMILSPIAFIAMVFPGLSGQAKQWTDALIGQSFFAPIYFVLTWVVIIISRGLFGESGPLANNGTFGEVLTSPGSTANLTSVGVIMNFMIMTSFLIASLVIAKQWSSKAGSGVVNATKWLTGATVGTAAFAGRQTFGRVAEGISGTDAYKRLEKKSVQGGAGGFASRLALGVTDKTRRGSFDARSGGVGKLMSAAGVQYDSTFQKQGGYEADKKAYREFMEKPGTKSYKERQERGRKAQVELDITDNLSSVEEYDRLVALETAARAGGPAMSAADTATLLSLRTPDPTTGRTVVDTFERAINNSTTKEIEAIVESNKKLLDNQEFANRISVQQLETLNKSDKFTEQEKDLLKNRRFSEINSALAAGGAGAASVGKKIKALSDSELEMINPNHLKDMGFVEQLRTAQVETINKSNKFTTTQKNDLRNARRAPLLAALSSGNTAYIKAALKELGHKEIAAMDSGDLESFAMLRAYTVPMLKRMATEMDPSKVSSLRTAMTTPPGSGFVDPSITTWLANPDNFSG